VELLIVATAAAFIAGCLVCIGLGPRRPCDVVTGSVVVTLALIVLLGKVLLLLGVFRPVPVTIAAMCAAVAASGWLAISGAARQRARVTLRMLAGVRLRLRFSPVGCVAAGVMVLIVGYESAMGARLPPVAWDSLYYHLISVAEWVRTGHFVAPLPGLSSRNPIYIYYQADSFPKDAELTASWLAVFTHNSQLVGLSQVLYMPLLVGGLYGICRHLDVRAGLAVAAAAIVTMTPAVIQELGTNYVDVAAAGAVLAAFQFLLSAFPATPVEEDPTGPKVRALVLSGIAFSLAAGIKPTNLEYCAAGLALTIALCIRESRRLIRGPAGEDESALPRPGLCMLAVAAPMLALGSFWYIRTWLVWGSPVWPIQLGPFPGVVTATQWTDVSGLAIPPQLRNLNSFALLVRSWVTPGLSLGDIWIFVLLPAIGLATIIAVKRRRPMPVLTVVLPLFVLNAVSPGAWQSRFEIPTVAAGAIALALVCESVARHRSVGAAAQAASAAIVSTGHRIAAHRRTVPYPRPAAMARRLLAAALSAFALCLAASTAWATANTMAGWQAGPSVSITLQMLREPAAVRANLYPWDSYDLMNQLLARPGGLAFFSNSPPGWVLPFAGLDFSRAVVVLSPYIEHTPPVVTGAGQRRRRPRVESERTATSRFRPFASQMRSMGATYLFVEAGTPVYSAIAERVPAQLHPLVNLSVGIIYELVTPPARPQPMAAGPAPVPHHRQGSAPGMG
jgi:hypothetical protein